MKIIAVLPLTAPTLPAASTFLSRIAALGPCSNHAILLVADHALTTAQLEPIANAAKPLFPIGGNLIRTPFTLPDESYPYGHNWRFETAARHVASACLMPWLWLDPRCLPLDRTWLSKIEAEYFARRKPFMGHVLTPADGAPHALMASTGVYPSSLPKHMMQRLIAWRGEDFERTCAELVVPEAHATALIRTIPAGVVYDPAGLPKETVLVHAGTVVAAPPDAPIAAPAAAPTLLGRNDAKPCIAPPPARSYYHSGNLGDVIYALAAIKLAGGGRLLLGPKQRRTALCDRPITEAVYEKVEPLLAAQPYLTSVKFTPRHPGTDAAFDLNTYRSQWQDAATRKRLNIHTLVQFQCHTLGVAEKWRPEQTWLTVPGATNHGYFTISRSARFRSDGAAVFPWPMALKALAGRLLFVGLPEEHAEFQRTFSTTLPYWRCADFLDLARIIAGGRGHIGNQSFPTALALALGVPVLQEHWPQSPDCLIPRSTFLTQPFIEAQLKAWSIGAPQPTSDRLHLSLLCHNRLDLTQRCLTTLDAHTPHYPLTITDNASTDGTVDYLTKWAATRPHVRLVLNRENLGYKTPHDLAYDHARSRGAEFFCALNNDTELGPEWTERALAAFDADPGLALVGNSAGACSCLHHNFHGYPAAPGEPPEYVEGSLLVARVAHVASLGPTLFAPPLQFIYGEDSDLSLRARERGYRIAVLNLNCRHLSSQTIRTLDDATKTRIAAAQEANHAYLRQRWSVYLKRRSFRYQILVVRKRALGDVIDVTAILPAIKQRYPDCEIRIQTDFPEVFQGNPHVAEAAKVISTPADYTYNLNLAYENRPAEHTLTAYATATETHLDLAAALPQLFASHDDTAAARRLLPGNARYAILHPGPTGWKGKDWPLARWVKVAAALAKQGYTVATVGKGDPISGTLDLRAKTPIGTLYAMLQRAALFIGLDSGPSHVAQAAGTPSLVLFGTIWAHLKLFPASRARALQADVKTVPCVGEHHRLPPPQESSQCSGACMEALTVEAVLEAAAKLPAR